MSGKVVSLVIAVSLVVLLGSCWSRQDMSVGAHVMGDSNRPMISSSGYDITPLTPQRVKELSKDLDPAQIHVACDAGTERAFTGKFWKNKEDGTYTCVVCGLPLFKSSTKFESGTGWPSFFEPFDPDHVHRVTDRTHGMVRVEIRCGRSGSHLGHVFTDGPAPTGQRYCINSAAMNFIPEGQELPPESRPAVAAKPTPGGDPPVKKEPR